MSNQNRRRFRFSFKINEDTMTSIVVYSLLFCMAVTVVGIIFAWFDKDISSIVDSTHRVFGAELGICGVMKIYDKCVERSDRKEEERRAKVAAKVMEARREFEK